MDKEEPKLTKSRINNVDPRRHPLMDEIPDTRLTRTLGENVGP